ncbi:MAG: oligoendopeptidase F [Candidatus Izemoplasmataceae bacterium]
MKHLYENLDDWNKDLKRVKEIIGVLPDFKGRLGDYEAFKEYYDLEREVSVKLNKLYQYAHLKSDLNKKDVENSARVQTMSAVVSEYQQATSFESPEILTLGEEKVNAFLEKDEALKDFKFPLKKLFHQSQHILDAKRESLLANFSELSGQGSNLHGALAVADNSPKEVTLSDGSTVAVTNGNFRSLIADAKTAEDREKIFRAVFDHYEAHKHTYAEIYNTVLKSNVATMKSRNYDSTLEAALHHNAIDPVVYHNLVDTAKESTNLLKRYYAIRKEALGLEKHHTYDRFIPLAESSSKFEYEEAKKLFFDAIDHLDDDFKEKAKDALKEGFVDVYEQDGKQTGAYSSSSLNEHPYILLNFDKTLGDVFTVAHEGGHSMHSLFAGEHQPEPTQNYTIFVAEIASTFNEHLLLDHFINNNKGTKEDKIQLLQQSIDDIAATFYRQTLFAAYELKAHEMAEAGTPITYESLSQIMIDLYKEFYDIDIREEGPKPYVWAYIPHFFFAPYYVYQYATSFAASLKLYEMVKEDPSNIQNHMDLLKSGGDDFPMNQTRRAGLDLTDKETFRAVTKRLKTLLDELELALKE